MTYEQFKNKYNGQYVDVDNYPKEWKYQCFDLAQLYFQEVLNVPDYVLAGCKNVCNMLWGEKRELLDEYFDEVSIYEMCAGDVTIWESNHIAIFDNWDGNQNWYFSQNPNPCEVINCELSGLHAFRRKRETPPLPAVTPNVERDEYKNQIEVFIDNLRVRTQPVQTSDVLGYASKGFYNYYETANNEGYTWYRIADNQWVAYNEEWDKIYPAKPKDKYVQFKVLSEKDGYVEIDLGKVFVKKD